MKRFLVYIQSLLMLVLISGCSEYNIDLPTATPSSVLDKQKDALWYSFDPGYGLHTETYFSPDGLMMNELSTQTATAQTYHLNCNIIETGSNTYKGLNSLSELQYKGEYVSPNHIKLQSFDYTTNDWLNLDLYRVTKTKNVVSGNILTASDLELSSFADVEILTKMNLKFNKNKDNIIPISGGLSYVKVNSDDPYVIKIHVLDGCSIKIGDSYFSIPHYENILACNEKEVEELFGSIHYVFSDPYGFYYELGYPYEGSIKCASVAFYSSKNVNDVLIEFSQDTDINLVIQYLDNAYEFRPKGSDSEKRYYFEKGIEDVNKTHFIMLLDIKKKQILYEISDIKFNFEIEDFTEYLNQSLDDLNDLWGKPFKSNEDNVRYLTVRTGFVNYADFYFDENNSIYKIVVKLISTIDSLEYFEHLYGEGDNDDSNTYWIVDEKYKVTLNLNEKILIYELCK